MADTDTPSQETDESADKRLPEAGNDCQELDAGCQVQRGEGSPDVQERELGSDVVAVDGPELYNGAMELSRGTGPASPTDQTETGPASHADQSATGLASLADQTATGPASHTDQTVTGPASLANQTATGPASPTDQTGTGPASHTDQTATGPASLANQTATGPASPTDQTETGPASPTDQTATGPASLANQTATGPASPTDQTAETGPASPTDQTGTGLASLTDQTPTTVHQTSPEEAATVGWKREPLVPEGLDDEEAGNWRPSLTTQEQGESTPRRESVESSISLSLSSSSSHHESGTIGIGSYHSDMSCSLTRSQLQAIGYHTPGASMTTVRDLSSPEHHRHGGRGEREPYEPIDESVNEPDSEPICGSPFLVVKKSDVTDVSQFEYPGLLYARTSKVRHDRDTFHPADEVAEDVLEAFKGNVHEEVVSLKAVVLKKEGGGEGGEREASWRREVEAERRDGLMSGREQRSPDHAAVGLEREAASPIRHSRQPPPIDPGVLLHLERDAQKLAASLAYTMDNLRNSLHAMTVCSQQSVQLHRETMENLHKTVDANVKAMYTFMAKFEELNKNVGPMLEIAAQIRELNETLRTLERQFRVP